MRMIKCKTGWFFSAIYLGIILASIAMAMSAGADYKGRFVFLQLPLALQSAGLDALGLRQWNWLNDLDWGGAYIVIGLPTFVLFFAVGCALGVIFKRWMR